MTAARQRPCRCLKPAKAPAARDSSLQLATYGEILRRLMTMDEGSQQ